MLTSERHLKLGLPGPLPPQSGPSCSSCHAHLTYEGGPGQEHGYSGCHPIPPVCPQHHPDSNCPRFEDAEPASTRTESPLQSSLWWRGQMCRHLLLTLGILAENLDFELNNLVLCLQSGSISSPQGHQSETKMLKLKTTE